MRIACLPALLLAAVPAAQTEDFAALDAAVRFQLDDAGQILISPAPGADGAADASAPLVELPLVLQNGGVLGWLAMAYQGAGDIASMADAGGILRRLGRSDDAALFAAIRAQPERHHERLLRLLAIRHVADRGLKPALGPLEEVVADEATESLVRRAAEEAIAALRGEPLALPPRTVPPVAEALAAAPADLDVVWQVDHWRLPPGRILLRVAGKTGLVITERAIRSAEAEITVRQWAGSVQAAEGVGALPYEAARRFGNHRFDRTLTALCVGAEGGEPDVWIRSDGRFEIEALRDGLDELQVPFEEHEQRLVLEPEPGTRVVVEPTRLTMTTMSRGHAPLGEEAARELATAFDRPEQIVVHVREGATLPDLPPPLAGFGLPRAVALALPVRAGDPVMARIDGADQALRALIVGQVGALPRLLDGWVDELEDPEPFEPLVDALRTLKLEVEGETVTARVSLEGIDLEDLLLAVVRSGAL